MRRNDAPPPNRKDAIHDWTGGGAIEGAWPRAEIVKLADVEPEEIRWLWADRIPLGKLSLIVGDPNGGKSFVSLDMAARVSTGRTWPDLCDTANPAGGVVLLGAEDGLADTVRPRLDAAGADCGRVFALESILLGKTKTDGTVESRLFNLATDIERLDEAITRAPDCRLVVIDPISAYMGQTNTHRDAEMRRVLAPLSKLAERRRVAVVAISHLNKNSQEEAMYRTMASMASVAAARSVWIVARAKDDQTRQRRLFLHLKNNIAEDHGGLAFTIEAPSDRGGTASVIWDNNPVHTTPDEALAVDTKPGKADEAAEWLRDELSAGPLLANEVKAHARAECITDGTLKRAKNKLGVEAVHTDYQGKWLWRLPGDERPYTPRQVGEA